MAIRRNRYELAQKAVYRADAGSLAVVGLGTQEVMTEAEQQAFKALRIIAQTSSIDIEYMRRKARKAYQVWKESIVNQALTADEDLPPSKTKLSP